MLTLILFAFLAGVVTILSPCILPILPIVLSGTVGKGKMKPLGIILGFIVSFTFFTLFLAKIVQITGISADALRIGAAVVLILFGISMLTPKLQVLLEQMFSKLSKFGPKADPNAGFGGGFLTGLSIGLIWVPCVGPIMASVIALAATSTVTAVTFFITLSYALGSGIPMFFIMIGGRSLLNKAPKLMENTEKIQKGFGILMIVLGLAIFLNYDRDFEAFIAQSKYGIDLTNLENNSSVINSLNQLKGNGSNAFKPQDSASGLFNSNSPAPEFVGVTKWLNTDKSISIKDLKGKVVLVDFWTYTCINCIRTLPYVTSWYDKYKDDGFVVIGVHTPEFQFEHETKNVDAAISRYKIHYPVAQDNDYKTWSNYNNQYWPAEYLIDAKGVVRRTHFGEGEYDQMETAIQTLLKEAGQKVNQSVTKVENDGPTSEISPESYLGSERMLYEVPDGKTNNGSQEFNLEEETPLNHFSFGGNWNITDQYATAGKGAKLSYHFLASKVFLVMRPGGSGGKIRVLLNGAPIPQELAGKDVKNGIVTVDSDRLYDLVSLPGVQEGNLQLEFMNEGVQAFAFTFGW